jgi:hypothetical protein
MPGETPFSDTCYLVWLYLEDHGFEAVRHLAGQASVVAAAWHAQAEVATAFHRAYRERGIPDEAYSNDRHFLAAAPLFGIRGIDVLPPI